MTRNILLLPGDGIGPEIVAEAKRVLLWFRDNRGMAIALSQDVAGGAAIDKYGTPLAPATLKAAQEADAVLLGAIGGPKWDNVAYDKRPEAGLLTLRKEMGLFANLRPVAVLDALTDASTLKPDVVRGLDILFARELTGGIYFGEPRGITNLENGERRGVDTQVYTTPEIIRIARVAFEAARGRKKKVCSVDKANVMASGKLWREEVVKLHAADYPDVELSHMLVDACAMQLLRNPRQFDVIVTDNLFGDILSDEASMLSGSLGMLPSASLGAADASGKRRALYEPIHGSAPDIAGKGIANPLATILSVSMMFRYSFGWMREAEMIENAVKDALKQGARTPDIVSEGFAAISTDAMGEAVIRALGR